MILLNEKICHIAIPKTAGTTVIHHLYAKYPRSNKWPAGLESFQRIKNENFTYWKNVGHATLKESIIQQPIAKHCYKTCTVRNPYDRLVSLYYHCYRAVIDLQPHYHRQFWVNNNYLTRLKSFESFVEFYHSEFYPSLQEDEQLRQIFATNTFGEPCEDYISLFLPQSAFVFDNDDKMAMDEVFRFEEIEKVLDFYKIPTGKRHQNKNPIKPQNKQYRDYYSKHTKDLVKNFWEKDLDLFRYAF
jgi:hypothetical protein